MIDLEQYVRDATRTESQVEEVVVDPRFLGAVLQIFIASGTMLDQIKKHVFYGKDYKDTTLKSLFINIAQSMDDLQLAIKDIHHANIKMMSYLNEGTVDVNTRLFHATVGAATEATELMEALVKMMHGEVDGVNILEEFGDIEWYSAIAHDELGGCMEQTLITNINKLKKRYPEKFTSDDAINRDLKAERKILETNTLDD